MATVTVTSTTTKVSPTIRFDKEYLTSFPGILKIAQIVVSLIGFICVQVYPCYVCSPASWFSFVSMTAFWTTLFLLVFYTIHIIERLHVVPWLLGELIYCALWTLFYCIGAIVLASYGRHDPAWAAGAFFGFVAMVLYGVDAFFKFKSWRSGEIAQGERTVSSQTTTASSPPPYPTAY